VVDLNILDSYDWIDESSLEDCLLKSIAVAGHNATSTTKAVNRFLTTGSEKWGIGYYPFEIILEYAEKGGLEQALQTAGVGCYTRVARAYTDVANAGMNLRTCSFEDLEAIYGIGPKTARMFVLYTRSDVRCAVLDVHVLRYLKDCGYEVPAATPTGRKYAVLEAAFLEQFDKSEFPTIRDFDFHIWEQYSGRK